MAGNKNSGRRLMTPEWAAAAAIGRVKSLENRRKNAGSNPEMALKTADDLIRTKVKYVKSTAPLAIDTRTNQPSVQAELGKFIESNEGIRLLRQALRATLIKAAHGDNNAMKTLFGNIPLMNRKQTEDIVEEEIHETITTTSLSPAELAKARRESND